METRLVIRYFLYFLTLYLLQIFLFNYITIGAGIFVSIYILTIMLFPSDFNKIALLIIAFFNGLIIDFSNDTVAINTLALTFATFVRPFIFKLLSQKDNYKTNKTISISNMSFRWFILYSITFTFIFEFCYYFFDIFKFSFFGTILIKTILATLITVPFIIILHLLFYKNK